MRSKVLFAAAVWAIALGCHKKTKGPADGVVSIYVGMTYDVAVNEENVYWTDVKAGGALRSMSVEGGTTATLATQQNKAAHVALDAEHVYWTTDDVLLRASLDGSNVATLAPCADASPIALDAQNVYFVTSVGQRTHLASVPLAGGNVTTLVSDVFAQQLKVDDTSIYYTKASEPYVRVLSRPDGATESRIPSGEFGVGAIAVDDESVYFAARDLMKVSKSNPELPTSLASGKGSIGAILIEGDNIYWVDSGSTGTGNVVLKTPKSGGTSTTVVSGLLAARELAVGEYSLFVATNDGLTRVTPK